MSPYSNGNLQKWSRNTTPIVGYSVLFGIEEKSRISKKYLKVKVKNFSGATINDIYTQLYQATIKKIP